jgi:hypothetical protein
MGLVMKRAGHVFVWFVMAAGCGFPRPSPVGGPDDGDDGTSTSVCSANQPLRCDGSNFVHCNSNGTAELAEACSLGCSASPLHCNEIAPSNGLAQYLDMAAAEPDLDLGMKATINTNDGTVVVDGKSVIVRSALVAQPSAPTILVFIVHSLTANDVTIRGGTSGGNAFALVSEGDVKVTGIFNASAVSAVPGPGAYNDATCKGGDGLLPSAVGGGAGGGGFGSAGGAGGSATSDDGTISGGRPGVPTGTATLIPLRGGCDSGVFAGGSHGSGGGAMQIASRTRISISGVVAANGSASTGGGSGGGLLIEAPVVEVVGTVVANGGGGTTICNAPGTVGTDGRFDAIPASGGVGCPPASGASGNGGAGSIAAESGASINEAGMGSGVIAIGGNGGGGVGRIRINTAPGGFHRAGLFSPNPSTGAIATR